MFTGIITDVGEILELEKKGDLRARIKTNYDAKEIAFGASIACDGICLTAVDFGENWFDVEISAETVSKTIIGSGLWKINHQVNLERSLKVGDELGGHIVSGHVDGLAEVLSIEPVGDSHVVWFRAPQALGRFVAVKGSVALDGVSLTVNSVSGADFSVNVIAHTWDVTTLGRMQVGSKLNMEIDMLARYVARLTEG